MPPSTVTGIFTTESVVSQQDIFGYAVQNGSSEQMMGVSSPQGNEPWQARQNIVALSLKSVALHTQVGPQQHQGSGASPRARHALHSQQHISHSSAQPSFGGHSSTALQQQQPATISDLEQHPMVGGCGATLETTVKEVSLKCRRVAGDSSSFL